MLTLISAHRYEDLQGDLVARLLQPGGSPFDAETVLVPSAAVRRQLTLALADRHGVCTQVAFSFLAQWLWRQIAAWVPGIPERSPFDPMVLRWRILRLLDDAGLRVRHPRLEAYLAAADEGMRFDLAQRIAGLFDQYLTYRPDWLDSWRHGHTRASHVGDGVIHDDERWQAELWRVLLAELGAQAEHPALDFVHALAKYTRSDERAPRLPFRVHVFCVPTMPPLYLRLLRSLADHIDVRLYVLNPCREYWLDLISARAHAQRTVAGEVDYHAVGHRLLSAWGRQTQAYLQLLLAEDGELLLEDLEADADTRPVGRLPLLNALQSGIAHLHDLVPGALHTRSAPDASLAIHVCHSLTRELEVLQDALLARFSAPGAPLPGEVLVVVPDLEAAASLIDGVFGNPPSGCYIPYVITGVAPAQASPVARALLLLLDTARGRLHLSDVLALLQQPLIGQRFGLAGDALEDLAGALREAGVHWGYDATHLATLGLPATGRHTLCDGRARLWLGYALPAHHAVPWLGELPAGGRAAADGLLIGAFDGFLQQLGALRQRLSAALTAQAWYDVLGWMLDTFFVDAAERRDEMAQVRSELGGQLGELQQAEVTAALPVAILMAALAERFEGPPSGGVPSGAVSFAAMSSLRNLPHRVVCILGLNDGEFPNTAQPMEFDLLARYPRAGDRQRGEDERNLFLDLLLSARDAVHLSYSGRSARDNASRPPSVLLAELLDALIPALCAADAAPPAYDAVRAALVHLHPLQPFDEKYFLPDAQKEACAGLLSYRGTLAAALRGRVMGQAGDADVVDAGWQSRAQAMPVSATVRASDPADSDRDGDAGDSLDDETADDGFDVPPFFNAALAPPGPEWRDVSIEQLVRFLHNPARTLLRDRLGLQLPHTAVEWADHEDFLPERWAATKFGSRLLPALLSDTPAAQLAELAAAGHDYPEGPLGDTARAAEWQRVQAFAARLRLQQSGTALAARVATLAMQIEGETWTVQGAAEGLFVLDDHHALQSSGRYHDSGVRAELEAWVRHLWLIAHESTELQWTTRWLLRDTVLTFPPLEAEQARAHLMALLRLYRDGLAYPVHFFPKSARRFQQTGRLAEARKVWKSDLHRPWGEDRDPAYRLALRGVADPLDAEFEAWALAVFVPLVQALESGGGP